MLKNLNNFNHFKLNLIHDAECGSGAPRLVRRTYEHIEEIGIEKARQTLFLLEITSPVHRVDQYYNEIGDYAITNVRYDDDRNVGNLSGIQIQEVITKDKIKYSREFFEGRITNETKEYLSKYHNPVAYVDRYRGELVGLFSFLDKIGATYFYMFDNPTLKSPHQVYNELDKIIKEYENSPDNNLFDKNAINKIERRLNKFIKKASDIDDKKFKYKKVQNKKDFKPYAVTITGSITGPQQEKLNNVHGLKDNSTESKLNFSKVIK